MEDHYVRLTLQEVARSDRWVMGPYYDWWGAVVPGFLIIVLWYNF